MDIHLQYIWQMDIYLQKNKNYGISEGASERRTVNIICVARLLGRIGFILFNNVNIIIYLKEKTDYERVKGPTH